MKTKRSVFLFAGIICFLMFFTGCKPKSDHYSRGAGIYPGNPKEDFSPQLVVENENYRNIALHRPAYHSSSYDYNLTAQLVTDGIIIHEMPEYVSLSTNQGVLPKNEREWLIDDNSITQVSLSGTDIWVQVDLNKDSDIPEITKINLNGSLEYSDKKPEAGNLSVPDPMMAKVGLSLVRSKEQVYRGRKDNIRLQQCSQNKVRRAVVQQNPDQ